MNLHLMQLTWEKSNNILVPVNKKQKIESDLPVQFHYFL